MEGASTDDEWWAAHSILHDQLGLPPWEWRAFEYPDAECPYPAGCEAAKQWHARHKTRPHAFALYEQLSADQKVFLGSRHRRVTI